MNSQAWDLISKNYFSEIVSPFQEGVINPLFKNLEKYPGKGSKTAADLGCGIGNLLPFLCPRFKKVWAVDFSKGMLRKARQKANFKNVNYLKRSMLNLEYLKGKLDVAVAVNSVLAPSSIEIDQMLEQIRATLKPGGCFMGVFPSMESILYHGTLLFDQELERGQGELKATQNAKRRLERTKYDFVSGLYTESGQTQKLYYGFELRKRLKRAGFSNVRLGKVLYPWDTVGDFEDFSGEPMMWDWFVRGDRHA